MGCPDKSWGFLGPSRSFLGPLGAPPFRAGVPARPLRRAGGLPSVNAVAAASAVPNQVADVISASGCANAASFVV
eukprot:6250751-Pyramimonas_sp.AAC.1